MKMRHAVLLVSLVLLFAGTSFAGVVDPPRIIFGGVPTTINMFGFNACTPASTILATLTSLSRTTLG